MLLLHFLEQKWGENLCSCSILQSKNGEEIGLGLK